MAVTARSADTSAAQHPNNPPLEAGGSRQGVEPADQRANAAVAQNAAAGPLQAEKRA
jgi:hypothetical protein